MKALVGWQLLEAWFDGNLVPADKFAEETENYRYPAPEREYQYFISPQCINLEAIFGALASSSTHAVFGLPQQLREQPQLLVLMPFSPELRPIYEDHIKKVAEQCSLSVARADDFYTHRTIMSDIWSAINFAEVIVADCSGRNPNVFYEIGLAHCLGKPTILTVQDISDIPFDLRHIRVVQYAYTPPGMKQFERVLEQTIKGIIYDRGRQKHGDAQEV